MAGCLPLAAVSFGLVALLFVPRPWAALLLRTALALGTIEWLRTAWDLAARRALGGQPYTRMLLILGAVAAFTRRRGVAGGSPGHRAVTRWPATFDSATATVQHAGNGLIHGEMT